VPSPIADLSNLHVVVPVRGSGDGKSRLGEALDAEERMALVAGMFLETLTILGSWQPARAVHVVTSDQKVRSLVTRSHSGARVVREITGGGLNAALTEGRLAAQAAGATAVLFLPADLPLLTTAALDSLLEAADAALAAGSGSPLVVLAPADARYGTNALLVAPPTAIEPHFGEASLEAHLRAAAATDASVQLVADPPLGFDLDTPDDLERLDVARLVALQAIGQSALDQITRPMPQTEVA
jgi:2-phospho-L-lactate/phosphoenolpyruvate guanylyltransferase